MSQETPQKSGPSILLLLSVFAAVVMVIIVVVLTYVSRSTTSVEPTPVAANNLATVGEGAFSDGINNIEAQAVPVVPLIGTDGESFTIEALQGNWVLMYFGYTYCPDFCPSTLTDWRLIKRDLAEDGDGLDFLLVSVDPNRDTPELLNRYVSRFDETFLAATGDVADLAVFAESMGAFFASQETTEGGYYAVDHTASTFLLDPEGRFVTVYAFGTPPSVIATDLRLKLAQ
jgi:protein SCO1/2